MAPLLEPALGVELRPAPGLDTDAFGSFSREVPRSGSPLDAARAKLAAAFARVPAARFGVASEGSFGPHPAVPLLPHAEELVLLVDREEGVECVGRDVGAATNFAQAIVADVAGARDFAGRAGFPAHGLIVSACVEGEPAPTLALVKDIDSEAALAAAVTRVLGITAQALVETDMRAHRNPTRMASIARATADVLRIYDSRCPACATRGYAVRARRPGLPCAACALPTRLVLSEVLACARCGHEQARPAAGPRCADPASCEYCNP